MASQARWRCCLTCIKVYPVSSWLFKVKLYPLLLRRSTQWQRQSLKWSFENLKNSHKRLKHTWHRKNITGEMRQVKELWTTSSPPLQRIASLEGLPWKQEFLQFAHHWSMSLLVSSCKVNLLQGCRRSWQWCYRLMPNGRCHKYTAHSNTVKADLWRFLGGIWISHHRNLPKDRNRIFVDPTL